VQERQLVLRALESVELLGQVQVEQGYHLFLGGHLAGIDPYLQLSALRWVATFFFLAR
jgi:hypothetical protein